MDQHIGTATGTSAPDMAARAPRRISRLPRRVYPFRVLGMGLAGIASAVVLYERQAGWPAWGWMLVIALAWPQLAWLRSRRSRDPHRTEVGNLLMDSALAGSLAALLHFNLLPSVLVLTLATVDKISTGLPRLWLRSLPWMLGGLLITSLATGFAAAPRTSMAVIVACLPMMILHTIGVALASQDLVQQIRGKNRQLDLLSRIDGLTGVTSRRHWQQQAEALLAEARVHGRAALLMIDIDRFKDINDHVGHAAGDEILRALGEILLQLQARPGLAGRYGGDEFALVVPDVDHAAAAALAERLRATVAVRTAGGPGPEATISIGLAMVDTAHRSLRDWIEAADAALYRAKGAGRNCVETSPG
ncbi:diguanylate cyclase domain-containing protein [Luteimonas yindakuii]|uniref:diguanylate cyclase domain-containing protein n=1 Tax=Luteimonas yindakuii TaxID=2565782 RepID=UPI001FC952A0|nr:diguanylate cyclase [Luteimonas yindakuii]